MLRVRSRASSGIVEENDNGDEETSHPLPLFEEAHYGGPVAVEQRKHATRKPNRRDNVNQLGFFSFFEVSNIVFFDLTLGTNYIPQAQLQLHRVQSGLRLLIRIRACTKPLQGTQQRLQC